MTDRVNDIDGENRQTLMAIQALLGYISSDVFGVALEYRPGKATFHFLVSRHSADLDEDIDDIVSDFEGLNLPDAIDVTWDITVEPCAYWAPRRDHRLIFLRKDH